MGVIYETGSKAGKAIDGKLPDSILVSQCCYNDHHPFKEKTALLDFIVSLAPFSISSLNSFVDNPRAIVLCWE